MGELLLTFRSKEHLLQLYPKLWKALDFTGGLVTSPAPDEENPGQYIAAFAPEINEENADRALEALQSGRVEIYYWAPCLRNEEIRELIDRLDAGEEVQSAAEAMGITRELRRQRRATRES